MSITVIPTTSYDGSGTFEIDIGQYAWSEIDMADTESTYSATIPESRDWEKVFP
jgi:hypothetical protein